MDHDTLKKAINEIDASREPRVEILKRAENTGARVGIFASSFNPPTVAHVELMRRAATDFSLDEMIALAGVANADKSSYDVSLEDRLRMLMLTYTGDPRASIALASHAYYVDMVDALMSVLEDGTDLHFVIGFDTFVRVLDRQDKYTTRYHKHFSDRAGALEYLLARAHLIVAGRAGARIGDIRALTKNEPAFIGERILYLDFPDDLADRSATEVRNRAQEGLSISGLVPAAVERYIHERELYK